MQDIHASQAADNTDAHEMADKNDCGNYGNHDNAPVRL